MTRPPDRDLEIWTIYDHPDDRPDDYVARCWLITGGGAVATDRVLLSADLDGLRGAFHRRGLVCIAHAPSDDAKIVESWL